MQQYISVLELFFYPFPRGPQGAALRGLLISCVLLTHYYYCFFNYSIHITCVCNQCVLLTILKTLVRVFKLSAYDPRACDPQLQYDPKSAIRVACSITLHVLQSILLFPPLHNSYHNSCDDIINLHFVTLSLNFVKLVQLR